MKSELSDHDCKILGTFRDTIANSAVSTPFKKELTPQLSDVSVASEASLDANGLPSLSFMGRKPSSATLDD